MKKRLALKHLEISPEIIHQVALPSVLFTLSLPNDEDLPHEPVGR